MNDDNRRLARNVVVLIEKFFGAQFTGQISERIYTVILGQINQVYRSPDGLGHSGIEKQIAHEQKVRGQ